MTSPQHPGYQPGYYQPQQPPQRRHGLRNGLLIGGGAVVGLVVMIAIVGALGAGGKKHPEAVASHAVAPAADQVFYQDFSSQFPALAVAGRHQVTSLGHSICRARQRGAPQAAVIRIMSKQATGIGLDAQGFVRLAETDLCPSQLAAVIVTRPRVIATFTGSGIQNTRKFTIGGSGTWKLRWSYSCAAFGYSGNFIVSEDGSFGAVDVNELGMHGHGSTYGYNDAGRHYLQVNSECDWRVRVIGVP